MNIHTPVPASPAPSVEITIKPTRETYDRLQQAYDHFNRALFEGTLPNALITLQRRKGTYGYFARAKFQREDGRPADEIALNPTRFHERTVKDVLSTMVHEMVHLWQHHQGTPGRGRYHNREWAERMKAAGLLPTDTGLEGGAETGERVYHLVIPKGPFDIAADRLMAKDFTLIWREVPKEIPAQGEGEAQPAAPQKSGRRLRYCCPECDLRAWAKHDARLMCGEHRVAMVPTA